MIAAASPVGDQLLDYSSSATTVININQIYDIRSPGDCGAVTCKLQVSSACNVDISASSTIVTNSEITVAGVNNNAITIKRNYQPGWGPHVVCIRCDSALTHQPSIITFRA